MRNKDNIDKKSDEKFQINMIDYKESDERDKVVLKKGINIEYIFRSLETATIYFKEKHWLYWEITWWNKSGGYEWCQRIWWKRSDK